jgi:cell division septal protein FtsQ
VAVLAVAALGVYAWHAVPRLSRFHIRQISVVGTDAVPDLQVRARVDKLIAGKTIFTLDHGAIDRNLEQLPFVRRVSVHTNFPDGIEIRVHEYQPLALGISTTGSWLVARDGRVLSKARLSDWIGRVPVVRLEAKAAHAGLRAGDEPALRLLRIATSTFPGSFRTVDVTGSVGTGCSVDACVIVGQVVSGPKIIFGGESELDQKLLVAARLLSMYGPNCRDNVRYIDVTVAARPAVAFTGGRTC